VNEKGVAFYDRLIDGMLERGLKPFATLYHWDLPSALQDRGGWLSRDIAGWFADYASLVGRRFGDRLATTATINEPWCVAVLSHLLGKHAPGLRDLRAAARSMHHVLLAHGEGIRALRAEGAGNLGIVINLEKSEAATSAGGDVAAAKLWDGTFNRWFLGGALKGEYPPDITKLLAPYLPEAWQRDMHVVGSPVDWCGINYYTRTLMRHDEAGGIFPWAKAEPRLETTDIGWEIYPEGLTEFLLRVARDYTSLPLYVTENGMAERRGLDDERRVRFHADHLKALLAAKAEGVDVRGYFAWSLLDNFEWAEGYAKRFGLVEVDFETLERRPRASYRAFAEMLTEKPAPRTRRAPPKKVRAARE
jgi:beta-glucosidase